MADRITSKDSGWAPYETFFHDFELEAFPFFNYWTADESTNDTLELENRDINEMPRFVKIVWNTAPDLVEEKTTQDKANPPNLMRTSEGPGIVGSKETFIVDGVQYTPEQLRPADFSKIVGSLANADIAAGVIQSTVSLPLVSSGIATAPPPFVIDRDAWFENPSSSGIPLMHLKNALMNRSSGYFNMAKIMRSPVNMRNRSSRNELFNGQFSAAPSNFVNNAGSQIDSVNPNSPALSMRAKTAASLRNRPPSQLARLYEQVNIRRKPPPRNNTVNVNFVDTGIGSVVDEARVNAATSAAHANSIAAAAQSLRNLIAYSESGLHNVKRKITLKSFDAPNGLAAKEYVGYIIEKYEQIDGVFVLKEIIGIADPYADEYYDTKVRYGGIYRYRIRSIMRWVRPKNITVTGEDTTVSGDPARDPGLATSSTTLTPNQASYFGSQWSKEWATIHIIDEEPPNPPDQLQVRPESHRKRIVINFQIPENDQRDIYMMTLYRRVIDKKGRDVVPWNKIAVFDMTKPGYYVDDDVDFVPQTPVDIEFKPAAPYRYIYAVTSTSVHNGESTLSEQIGARLNEEWQRDGELPAEFYSSSGVDLDDDGIFSTIPIKMYKTHVVVSPNNSAVGRAPAELILMGQERNGTRMLTGNKYILRVHSLDTGETHDLEFSLTMDNVQAEKIEVPTNIYVPSANEQYFYNNQALTSG